MSEIKPGFYATKNLMGYDPGLPDMNRRFVHHHPSFGINHEVLAICYPSDPKKGWTEKDQRALNAYLAVLNEDER